MKLPKYSEHGLCSALYQLYCLLLLALALLLGGCASHRPYLPSVETLNPAFANMQTKTDNEITVSAALLTAEEEIDYLNLDLAEIDLQAVWLRIENKSDNHVWFIRNQLDRDVYSADEVAEMLRDNVADEQFDSFQQHLRNISILISIDAETATQGYLFVPKHEGGRYIDVRLTGDVYDATIESTSNQTKLDSVNGLREYRFGFAIPLPDGEFDYERLHTENIYSNTKLPDLSKDEFRKTIESLPCCAKDSDAENNGDPLNVVIVAKSTDLLNSLTRSGWSFTHRLSLKSVLRLVGATLQGESYPVAPVSSLYVFNRKQDFALQRARRLIDQRNHMRFWLAPFTYQKQQVWVGQVSRDIGIKLTSKSPTFTTHIIDPQVDLTREYLLHSLMAEGFVKEFGFASGAPKASVMQPSKNLTDDPYFSDGKRLVMILSPDPLPIQSIRSLQWERSAAPVASGKTTSND
ncbi:MAG: LssY C-terminal domain-containing protein [Gammaproteobacteria bacterium]|nr:LssY C-terminal domain-containing protein [Gammaproteobacteria bacterium]NNJ72968.1 hypothetical protein [Enterobacterales bacterium]